MRFSAISFRRLTLLVATGLVLFSVAAAQAEELTFQMSPIGHVSKQGVSTQIVLDEKFQDGLLGLEDFSHVWVIWWFDQNDSPEQRAMLQVHPRGDARNPLSGVFATRAPVRPNLIGLTLCRIVSVHKGKIEIDSIDAFDGTPVVDLKPYIPSESVSDAMRPQRY